MRLLYLDVVRGVAVAAMVLAHLVDSWTREADRHDSVYFTTYFIGGVASPLFLLLAGLAGALSAGSKSRRAGSLSGGARAVRARGWEIFLLGLVFRLQSQVLGWGPLDNLLRVDMLNAMGLSLVAAFSVWPMVPSRPVRVWLFAGLMTVVTMATPLIRATPELGGLPDPIEAYVRPAGGLAAFPLFPWAGFVFAGVMVGDLVDAARQSIRRDAWLQVWLTATCALGIWLAWQASLQPALFPTARFWHDSPTFFFIRLGLAAMTVPVTWTLTKALPARVLEPVAVLGRSSLFVYWIHVEMVYGVVAEPLKRQLEYWQSMVATAFLVTLLYVAVLLKNRLLAGRELKGPFRWLEPILR
jgi:uncharacterized membrane protein